MFLTDDHNMTQQDGSGIQENTEFMLQENFQMQIYIWDGSIAVGICLY